MEGDSQLGRRRTAWCAGAAIAAKGRLHQTIHMGDDLIASAMQRLAEFAYGNLPRSIQQVTCC
jgi:hypothetical protein